MKEFSRSRFKIESRYQHVFVDEFVTRMAENYGDTVSGSVRGGYDPAAAAHGSVAADSAQLSFGDVEGNQSSSPDIGAAPLAALPAT